MGGAADAAQLTQWKASLGLAWFFGSVGIVRRLLTLLGALTVALLVAAPLELASAQPPPGLVGGPPPPSGPGGFFDFLFGPRQVRPPPQQQQQRPAVRRPAKPAEPPLPVAEVTPKDEKARKIMVIGDFMAGGLAWGLDQTFADEPKIAVIDKSNNSSGLVRDDYYDWNKQLLGILNQVKPDVVVVALGANDRQQIRLGKDRLAPRSDAWGKVYSARIAGMADTLRVYGRPYFWVSAPPMRATSASRDMTFLNGLFKPTVTTAGGHYIDIWNGFSDDNGNYISSGPDVDGQLRALRTSDGINFTRAGRLKLAFYAEREIRKQTGIGTGSVDLFASASQTSQIEIGPDGVKRLVGPVISLSDPLPGASRALVGSADNPDAAMSTDTPQYRLIVKGAAPPVVAGRADDFTWPPRQRAAPAAPVKPTAAAEAAAPPTAQPPASAN
jgi:hypothetical protein